jgi:hypothetical protein
VNLATADTEGSQIRISYSDGEQAGRYGLIRRQFVRAYSARQRGRANPGAVDAHSTYMYE